jgi:hypothetical protein
MFQFNDLQLCISNTVNNCSYFSSEKVQDKVNFSVEKETAHYLFIRLRSSFISIIYRDNDRKEKNMRFVIKVNDKSIAQVYIRYDVVLNNT